MKILRLLLFEACNRACPMCCNRNWDLKTLPQVESFKEFAKVLLTGGEPMLRPNLVRNVTKRIKKEKLMPVYLYTAKVYPIQEILSVLFFVDGLTLTLHDQCDVDPFLRLNSLLPAAVKSLRLNVFDNVVLPAEKGIGFGKWQLKRMTWQENCPLPEGEVFMRL